MYIQKNELRFFLVFLVVIAGLAFFSVKLVLIQIFHSAHLTKLAEKQHNHLIELEPIRGMITDRQARPLAFNIPVYSLYANPRVMSEKDKRLAIEHLPGLLGLDRKLLTDRLSRKKYFVWLKRKLPLDIVEQVKKLKISGLDFLPESKRFYPNGALAAHIIGFSGIDNNGLEGVELYYNQFLQGQPGHTWVLRDARQRELLIENNYVPPQDGYHVVLTIDETIQYLAEKALDKAFAKYHAKSATIIVMDVKTGEILALANRPTFNLEHVTTSPVENRTNRAFSYVLEPGSVFKIVTASAALEEGAFKETDKIFCENGEYRIANHILHDHHPHGTLSFMEVFEQSSNIGVAKIAQKLGPAKIYEYARRFGFGKKTNIEFGGEVSGLMKDPSRWSKVSIGTIPMGHEVTATPLQIINAMAVIANDGVAMKPYMIKYIKNNQDEVIKSFEPQVIDRVISPETAKRVRDILTGAVERGTGKKAMIPGVKVAGKTGTAQKVIDGQYSHDKFYATFVGFAPADNPRLAAIVVLDEPRPYHFGGVVSAPVFKEVVENALRYLESSPVERTALSLKP